MTSRPRAPMRERGRLRAAVPPLSNEGKTTMHRAVEAVIRAAEAHIDSEESRSHSDAAIEAMDHIRSAIAVLRATDPKIDRNRISAESVEIRIHGSWTPIDDETLRDASTDTLEGATGDTRR